MTAESRGSWHSIVVGSVLAAMAYITIWQIRTGLGNISIRGAILHSDQGTQYTSDLYRKTLSMYGIVQSMNSVGGRCHNNACCESMWARLKTELLYGRYTTEELTVEELKVLVWIYFISYWNNWRNCTNNGGLSPMIMRQGYYDSI